MKDTQHLSHDAVRGDHGHVRLDSLASALVNVNRTRLLAAAGADDLGGHGLRNELFLECQQGLQTPRLLGIFGQANLLQPKPLDFRLQFTVLRADSPQIEIVVPDVSGGGLNPDQGFFKGSDRANRPDAN